MKKNKLYLLLLILLAVLISCNAEKRTARHEKQARKHIQKAESKAPNELSKWCANRFDNTDSVSIESEFIRGVEVPPDYNNYDEPIMQIKGGIVTIPHTGGGSITNLPYRGGTVRVDTFRQKIYQRVVNTAALDSMKHYTELIKRQFEAKVEFWRGECEKEKQKRILAENEAKRRKKNNTILGGIILGYVLLKFIILWLKKQYPVSKVVGVAQKIF